MGKNNKKSKGGQQSEQKGKSEQKGGKPPRVVEVNAEMEKDDRIRGVFNRPEFMTVPQKVKKVTMDSRFEKAIKDKDFNLVSSVDKYGRKVKKTDNAMKDFYRLEGDQDQKAKYYDEDGKFVWNQQESSSEEEASDSDEDEGLKKKEESEEESEANAWDSDKNDVGDAPEEIVVGKRLALMDMDWDNMTAEDIFALFNSFCKGQMLVKKIAIYPSLYGIEQMKKDALYGPPKELYNPNKKHARGDIVPAKKQGKQQKGKKVQEESESEMGSEEGEFEMEEEGEAEVSSHSEKEQNDDDVGQITHARNIQELIEEEREEADAYNMEVLRQYELNKMKYYYAVVFCDSKKTAKLIEKEYNGVEFELSGLKLNIKYIADDLQFPQEPKWTCSELPPNYEFRSASSLNKAK
jgi:hypothetical protein